jgi:hypothetical protein
MSEQRRKERPHRGRREHGQGVILPAGLLPGSDRQRTRPRAEGGGVGTKGRLKGDSGVSGWEE